ncbi:hypothetical protein ACFPOA_02740 [Lysobacter niabensis]|uniref:primase 1D-like protein n=1 Tax=Agrilutibacter niabensis TaxID=380628 RepID=UPI00360ADC07
MDLNTSIAVGSAAHVAYAAIIHSHKEVESIELCRYRSPPPLQSRIELTDRERDLVANAVVKRQDGVTSFWQGVFASALELGWCSQAVVEAALFHNGPGDIQSIPVSSFGESLEVIFDPDERNVGLSSKLTLRDGTSRHLAMLDFRCEVGEASLAILEKICDALYEGGYVVVDSGHSYHACGMRIVTPSKRIEFLSKALIFSPIIDVAYLSHQLRQEFSTIRISRGGSSDLLPKIALSKLQEISLASPLFA